MTRTIRSTRTTGRLARLLLAAALTVAAASVAGCSKPADKPAAEKPAAQSAFPVTITDDTGNEVTIEKRPERIVSLAPADTEILFAVGAGDRVVGVSTFCDYPAEVKDLPKVGDFAAPNIEAVAGAKPDLVLATTGIQAEVVKQLEDLGATVIAIDPQTLDGVYEDIERVGAAVGEKDKATAVVSSMKDDVKSVTDAVAGKLPVTAFVEIGQNPLFTVGSGTLMNELITLGGGTNVVTEAGYVPYSAEQVVKANPGVYMATKGSGNDPAGIEKRPGYSAIEAVKSGRIVILDDNLVSRPGPRVIEGLKLIAAGLHPDAFK